MNTLKKQKNKTQNKHTFQIYIWLGLKTNLGFKERQRTGKIDNSKANYSETPYSLLNPKDKSKKETQTH